MKHNQCSQSTGIVQWLVWSIGRDGDDVRISSRLKKQALYDSLARILHKYLFKIEEIGSFGKSKHYYISGFMEKRERSSDEHIKTDLTTISHFAPKLLRERTERYLNEPFNMPLMDAFKKAAGEYKYPSKRLRKALETGNFKEFLPGEYKKAEDAAASSKEDGNYKRRIEIQKKQSQEHGTYNCYVSENKCCGCYPELRQTNHHLQPLSYIECPVCGKKTKPVNDYSWEYSERAWNEMFLSETELSAIANIEACANYLIREYHESYKESGSLQSVPKSLKDVEKEVYDKAKKDTYIKIKGGKNEMPTYEKTNEVPKAMQMVDDEFITIHIKRTLARGIGYGMFELITAQVQDNKDYTWKNEKDELHKWWVEQGMSRIFCKRSGSFTTLSA